MAVRFDPTKEVPSLELCKRLKELGYPQIGGGWYWVVFDKEIELKLLYPEVFLRRSFKDWLKDCFAIIEEIGGKEIIKAPTVLELGKWIEIAWEDMSVGTTVLLMSRYKAHCHFPYLPSEIDPNLLAKDLIWLAENGYVKFKGVKQ